MATTQDQANQLMQARTDIAELQTHLEYQRAAMADLKSGQLSLLVQLREIQDLLGAAKGGWRMLMLIGGAGVGAGAFISGIFSYIVENFHWRA